MNRISLSLILLASLLNSGEVMSECVPSHIIFTEIPDREAEKVAWRLFNKVGKGNSIPNYVLLFYTLPELESEGLSRYRHPWKLFERGGDDTWCVLSEGNYVELTRSWEHVEVEEFYGLPGSGRRRCEPPGTYLEAPAFRSASVELGESYVFHLEQINENDNITVDYVFLGSKLLDGWILLEHTGDQRRCYRDRGSYFDVVTESEYNAKIERMLRD